MSFKDINSSELLYIKSDQIDTTHAFTTRMGGVSGGIYSGLNLGTNRGDDPESVRHNYAIICSELGVKPEKLVFTRQVHGKTVRSVTSADSLGDIMKPVPYEADALVTSERGLPLIIFTADCIPILLHDRANGVIGACHAGWRGTVIDIAGETVNAMKTLSGKGAESIYCAIGPGIGPCCFETDSEVPEAVRDALGKDGDGFITRSGSKYTVDLPGVNRELLIRAGVQPENIDVTRECTHCNPGKFWSHRISGGNRGSQASIIMLK